MRKLGFRILKTHINAEKIEGSRREIYAMIIALFQVDEKNK